MRIFALCNLATDLTRFVNVFTNMHEMFTNSCVSVMK